MQDDDELHIEDIADDRIRRKGFAAGLIRRAWALWHPLPRAARRSRAARLALAGMTALLALVLVGMAGDGYPSLAGQVAPGGDPVPVQPSAATSRITVAGHAPTQAGTGPWTELTLPSPGGEFLWFAASPSDPATLYACTGPGDNTSATPPPVNLGGITLAWRTRDAGRHWTSLGLPSLGGTGCLIQVASDDPSRVTVQAGSQLYLSDDGGDSWSSIVLPVFPQVGQPGVDFLNYEVLPTAHHLYVQADFFGPPPTRAPNSHGFTRGPELSALARSDNEGRSWTFVGQQLGRVFFRPFVVGGENTLIASTLYDGAPSRGSVVWLSRDAGTTWAVLSTLDQGWTANLVTVPIPSTLAPPPVYAMLDEQIPSFLFRLTARQLSADGRTQSALPPLPVAGASPTRTGLLDFVGETPDGRLLALGVDPAKGMPPPEQRIDGNNGNDPLLAADKAPWLWAWDPAGVRWQVIAPVPPVPPSQYGCAALCWQSSATYVPSGDGHAQGMYLTLHLWNSAAPIADRIFLPDD